MSKYDAAVDQLASDDAAQVRTSVFQSSTATPEQAARAKQLGNKQGIPQPVAERNLAEVEHKSLVDDIDTLTRDDPVLRRFYGDPYNAKVGKDEAPALKQLTQALQGFFGGQNKPKTFSAAPQVMRSQEFAARVKEVKESNPTLDWDTARALAAQGVTVDNQSELLTAPSKPRASAASIFRGLTDALPSGAEQTRQGIRQQLGDLLGFEEVSKDAATKAARAKFKTELLTPQFESKTAEGVYAGGQSLVRNAPALAISVLTGSPMPALAAIGVQTEAEAYSKYRERGASGGMALLGAVGEGVTEVATELLPMGYIVNNLGRKGAGQFISGLIGRDVLPEQAATFVQDAIDTAVANPNKTWAEYFAERPDAAYKTLIATITQAGVVTAAGSVVNRAAMRAEAEDKQVFAAEQGAAQLEQLINLAQGTKLRGRDPETLAQLVQSAATESGYDGYVYVDGTRLAEAIDGAGLSLEQFSTMSSIASGELLDAVQSGSTVRMPLADLVANTQDTKLEQALLPHIRMTEDGLSRDEATQVTQLAQQELEQRAQDIIQQAADTASLQASHDNVKQILLDQLNTARRFSKSANELKATIAAASFTAMGARAGLTPEEMYERFSLKIQGSTPTGEAIGQGEQNDTQRADGNQAASSRLSDGGGLRGGTGILAEPSGKNPVDDRPLDGLAATVKVDGRDVTFAPLRTARQAASDYAAATGLPYTPARQYVKVDTERAARIAQAFEDMPHAPNDPAVKEAYDAMIAETLAQWQAVKATGLQVEFIEGADPYGNPRNAILDVVNNNHLWVYPTDAGFGGTESRDVDISGNPLLQIVEGETISGRPVRANDIFRIVHDYFGHVKEGVGFRADGEENAWRAHWAMYSPLARKAMTTETRGQNSWVNFGPFAESNKTADGASTQYAPQKIGLLPDWVVNEGATDDGDAADQRKLRQAVDLSLMQAEKELRQDGGALGTAVNVIGTHFSSGQRTVVDGRYYGSGLKGAERDRVFNSDDKRLRERTYFYVDEGSGVRPEAGVGALAHEAQLTNLYDINSDPLKLIVSGDINATESAILDAGFSGYYRANAFNQQGAAVVIGQASRNIQVKAIADPTRPAPAQEAKPVTRIAVPETVAGAIDIDAIKKVASSAVFERSFIAVRPSRLTVNTEELDTARELLTSYGLDVPGGQVYQQSDTTRPLAPNGKPSNLTPELYATVRTPEFKAWFGDWEKHAAAKNPVGSLWGDDTVSKAVDENGEPLIVYHGTDKGGFDEFKETAGQSRGDLGIFTSPNLDLAKSYVRKQRGDKMLSRDEVQAEQDSREMFGEANKLSGVYAGFLNIRNPSEINFEGASWNGSREQQWIVNINGEPQSTPDGKMYFDSLEEAQSFAAEFADPEDPDIGADFVTGAEDMFDTTDSVVREAREAGQDGAVIRQVRDDGGSATGSYDGTPSDVFVVFKSEQFKAIDNFGTFNPASRNIYQQANTTRGTFSPETLTISLLEKADLSTFFHELGHFYLEVVSDMASQPSAPAQVREDMSALLDWFKLGKDVEALNKWNSMTLSEKRQYHEKFAESFEQYLFEGKAPSRELQGAFSRVAAWMKAVYKSLQSFMRMNGNAGLTDEVRLVFDRLLATDEQIAEMQELRGMLPAFSSAKDAGMTTEEWAAYVNGDKDATEKAMATLRTRSLRDVRWLVNAKSKELRKISKGVAEKRKAVESEVRAEVEQEPVYAAQNWIKTGVLPDGTQTEGAKLSAAALKEMYGDDPASPRRYLATNLITTDVGLHPDVVAEMFGFKSGDQMVRSIVASFPFESEVQGRTDQRMLEKYGELTSEEGKERAAEEAIHNEARARFIATELAAINKGAGSVRVLQKAAKMFAEQLIAKRKIKDLKPKQHLAAETRAAKRAETAMRKGETQEAVIAKKDHLLNFYAAQETTDALAEVEKGLRYLDRVQGSETIDPAEREQIAAMLDRFDLRKAVTGKEIERRQTLAEWVETQRDMGVEPNIPPELLDEISRKHYREMPLVDFRGLIDTIKQIEHFGRVKHKLLTAANAAEFAKAKQEIVDSILLHAPEGDKDVRTSNTALGGTLEALKRFRASHIKAGMLARTMDGGKDGGALWEYLIRAANKAGDSEVDMRAKATRELAALVNPLLKTGSMGGKGMHIPEINRSMNRQARIAVALNTGNESNMQRLMGGEGWTADQVEAITSTLTAQEWRFVQGVWNYFESYRPLIAAKEKRVNGVEPKWLEATGRNVRSSDGEVIALRGGYYPVKYDPRASERAEAHNEADAAKQQMRAAYTSATTRRSFTKERADEVHGRPLLYSFGGIYAGVNEVIHDLSWHEFLIDANRLIRDPAISAAMRQKHGPEAHQQFKTWLRDVAQGEQGAANAGEAALGWIRQGVSISGLGFNVMTAMIQPLGLTQSWVRIGGKNIAQGIAQFIGTPDATASVHERSAFMRNRAQTRLREMAEVAARVEGRSKTREAIDSSAYWLMLRAQQMVDIPTWLGAYEKAIGEGNAERRALDLADQAVIDSQGSGMQKDMAAIERGGQALKLFTVFYQFFNTAFNLGVTQTATQKSKPQLAADYLLLFVVPVILGALLKDALTPGDSGDDDEKALAKKLIGEEIAYMMNLMVGVREVAGAAQVLTGTNQYGTDYGGPAGLRPISDLYKLSKQANQGEMDDGLRKAIVNTSGQLLRLPAAQINRSITGTQALAEGKTSNPTAAVFGYQEPK